jgi:hypothetical protein
MKKSSERKLIHGITLKKEEEFIIRSLRQAVSASRGKGQIDHLNTDIAPDTAYKRSSGWGISPLLFNALTRQASVRPLHSQQEKLLEFTRNDYLKTHFINERNYQRLALLLDEFSDAGIKVVLLKGMHLAKYVYMDIGLRTMGDVDLLVRKEDLSRAEELLFRMGYRYPEPIRKSIRANGNETAIENSAELLQELYKIRHHHLHRLINPAGISILEIHWTITAPSSPISINTDGLWKRADKIGAFNKEAMILSPEDLLLYLCVHTSFSHHLKVLGLKPCCDIAFTVNHYSNRLDWEKLKRLACEWGAEKHLYLTLRLSHEILGFDLPEGLLDSLRPESFNERIMLHAKRRILLPEDSWAIPNIGRFAPETGHFNQISYVFRRIFFPSKKELTSRYYIPPGSWRICLYYFARLFSLFYRKTTLYAQLFLYTLTHKNSDFQNYNLDSWLMTSDSEKSAS